jgi:hypothetical protein
VKTKPIADEIDDEIFDDVAEPKNKERRRRCKISKEVTSESRTLFFETWLDGARIAEQDSEKFCFVLPRVTSQTDKNKPSSKQ